MKVYYMIAGRLINRVRKNGMATLAKTIWEAGFLPISSGRQLSYRNTSEPELRARRTSAFHAAGQAFASSCSSDAVYNSLSQWAH